VPSCAGAYVSGAAGSNACPAGSVRIETEAACRTAAAAAGKDAAADPTFFVETSPIFPRGCYYTTNLDIAIFNTDPVGAGESNSQLLCAAVTIGTRACGTTHVCCACAAARRSCGGTWA
jgi:hypothetical protein